MVYLLGWDSSADCGQVLHQNNMGDCFWSDQAGTCNGLQWCCSSEDRILVHRKIDDNISDEVRVLIWKLEL